MSSEARLIEGGIKFLAKTFDLSGIAKSYKWGSVHVPPRPEGVPATGILMVPEIRVDHLVRKCRELFGLEHPGDGRGLWLEEKDVYSKRRAIEHGYDAGRRFPRFLWIEDAPIESVEFSGESLVDFRMQGIASCSLEERLMLEINLFLNEGRRLDIPDADDYSGRRFTICADSLCLPDRDEVPIVGSYPSGKMVIRSLALNSRETSKGVVRRVFV